jgi:hypothetical protein
MQEAIRSTTVEGPVLYVLAENPDTLYIAASKKICACMMVRVLRGVFVGEDVKHEPPEISWPPKTEHSPPLAIEDTLT